MVDDKARRERPQGHPGARADGMYKEESGYRRGLAQDGISLQKGGRNTPADQPAVRPPPPPAMTRPAASAAPTAAPTPSPQAVPARPVRQSWLPPKAR